MARKICADLDWEQHYSLGEPLGDALLRPTRIYVPLCLSLLREYEIHAFAHITGGGLTDNIPRVLPDGLGVLLDGSSWKMPLIFQLLQETGGISAQDMHQTFNCGIGLVAVVEPSKAEEVCQKHDGVIIGRVVADSQKRVSWQ